MDIRIIFLDLDDTLLNENKQVSEADKTSLWELYHSGIRIGYVTSRTGRKLPKLLQGMPCDFIAENNGNIITYFEKGKVSKKNVYGFSGEQAIEILNNLFQNPNKEISATIFPFELWKDSVYLNGEYKGKYEEFKNRFSSMTFQRIRIYEFNEPEKQFLNENISQKLKIWFEHDDCIIEDIYVNKGTAVKDILRYYNIKRENAMSFGDNAHDIPMFKECDYNIAMGNAEPELKLYASDITNDNNSSGVSSYLTSKLGLHNHLLNTSFLPDQGTILLNPIDKCIAITSKQKMEWLSNGGRGHEVLGIEPDVSEQQDIFEQLVFENSRTIARYIGVLAENIYSDIQDVPVLVSLVRGGTIHGALCKYYLEKYYKIRVPHYSVSIIRGVGIDQVALKDIINRHGDYRIRFIDGWTGSGVISDLLRECIFDFNEKNGTQVCGELSAVCDASRVCKLKGTDRDILLPDSCMNATVCGLISNIVYFDSDKDNFNYHGAAVWSELCEQDYTQWYYNIITSSMKKENSSGKKEIEYYGKSISNMFAFLFNKSSSKYVRLGIGESMRALFRANIDKILVKSKQNNDLKFLFALAEKKGVEIEEFDTGSYSCVTLIKE